MGVKAPCKKCDKREFGCHTKCDTYISFKKERQKELKKEREFKNLMTPNSYFGGMSKRDARKCYGDSSYYQYQ